MGGLRSEPAPSRGGDEGICREYFMSPIQSAGLRRRQLNASDIFQTPPPYCNGGQQAARRIVNQSPSCSAGAHPVGETIPTQRTLTGGSDARRNPRQCRTRQRRRTPPPPVRRET